MKIRYLKLIKRFEKKKTYFIWKIENKKTEILKLVFFFFFLLMFGT